MAMAVKDLMICQNFKGNLYGNLGNTEAITVNMEGCGPELLEVPPLYSHSFMIRLCYPKCEFEVDVLYEKLGKI